MFVFGTLKTEEVGEILYMGDFEECLNYAKNLDLRKFYDLSICEVNGVIIENIKSPLSPLDSTL